MQWELWYEFGWGFRGLTDDSILHDLRLCDCRVSACLGESGRDHRHTHLDELSGGRRHLERFAPVVLL